MKQPHLLSALSVLAAFVFSIPAEVSAYENFETAIYCTIRDVREMEDIDRLREKVEFLETYFHIDKVYLETHRRNEIVDERILAGAKAFFEDRGIRTVGGITTTGNRRPTGKFGLFCYSSLEQRKHLQNVVELTARHFDEIILDDFYFTDCRCPVCIEKKGSRSWADYRLDLMAEVSREVVTQTARKVNPDVRVIIKYPNWYAYYQDTGYNLAEQPDIFDGLYTGTETRDAVYHQQNLQPYQGYLIMRYLENILPGRNGGGWVDPLDMRVWNRYAEQLFLTLFAKADEITLFRFGALLDTILNDVSIEELNSINAPVAGYVFRKCDAFLGRLGDPTGLKLYRPVNSSGEAYLAAYLGMLGLPVEMVPEFPLNEGTVILTEAAKADPEILQRMKTHLLEGGNLVITSGLLRALQGNGIEELLSAKWTARKIEADTYTNLQFRHLHDGSKQVTWPVIDFPTNDAWKDVISVSDESSSPVLLESWYGDGLIHLLVIPDDFADLYSLPEATLNAVRAKISRSLPVSLEGPAKVALYLYDNDTFIVQSFLPHKADIGIRFDEGRSRLKDLLTGKEVELIETPSADCLFKTNLEPLSFRVYQYR